MRETTRLSGQKIILLCAIIGASFVITTGASTPSPTVAQPQAQANDEPSKVTTLSHSIGTTKSPSTTTTSTTTKQPDVVAHSNAQKNMTTGVNSTNSESDHGYGFKKRIMENQGMLTRTMYVLIGITAIILLYFGVRMVRLRARRSKPKRYGVISTRGTDLEMTPLDQEDDEDDSTLFDVQHRYYKCLQVAVLPVM
ncbi:hypothetical protein NP493_1044g00022 [Ridgeia piscesae]|uniref:Uncharacterized protein n=1 Tax=Ridgeia piscesae TaxID=27915 RepID=A0AAD9IWX8_RIDPI|nr:hypothetical protein NP493_5096g00002 [Ridgeia piscesae]KAK2171565.1 hypothetical protein NP493_1044g00022 [Ridgeia piscesae]